MQKKTLILLSLIFFFLEVSTAQIVINRIFPGGTVEFRNSGNTTVDVTNYQIINWANLSSRRTLGETIPQCGNLMMEPGSTLTINKFSGIKKEGGTVSLYNTTITNESGWADANDPRHDNLVDFVTWGLGDGNTALGTEIAVIQNMWSVGDLVPAFEDNEGLVYSGSGNSSLSWSTVTYPIFCGFNQAPANKSQLDNSNQYIARRFAPVLFQFVGDEGGNSEGELGDIPTKVNFDGDWNHYNNWGNLEDNAVKQEPIVIL